MISLTLRMPAHRVVAEDIERLKAIPVANLSDVLTRMTAFGPALRPYHAGGVLAGTAFTVKTRPGDNLLVHKALDMARPGDVLVIDGGGDLTNALMGEMMLCHAEARGLAGVVVNGSIRDLEHVRSHGFPVYAAGITHRGPYKDGPGEVNVPVSIGGAIVHPGDAVIGDADGVVSVPFADVGAVIAEGDEKHRAEQRKLKEILAGRSDRSWVDRALTEAGYRFDAND